MLHYGKPDTLPGIAISTTKTKYRAKENLYDQSVLKPSQVFHRYRTERCLAHYQVALQSSHPSSWNRIGFVYVPTAPPMVTSRIANHYETISLLNGHTVALDRYRPIGPPEGARQPETRLVAQAGSTSLPLAQTSSALCCPRNIFCPTAWLHPLGPAVAHNSNSYPHKTTIYLV